MTYEEYEAEVRSYFSIFPEDEEYLNSPMSINNIKYSYEHYVQGGVFTEVFSPSKTAESLEYMYYVQ